MTLPAFLRLLPLGALYLLYAVMRSRPEFQGDEGRYFQFAHNLLRGGYATQETLFLWNGPGYPLVLAAVLALKLPLLAAKLINACLLFAAVLYFLSTLRHYMSESRALVYAYAAGLYLLLHGSLIEFLMSEPLAVFLVSAAGFHFTRFIRSGRFSRPHFAAAALALAFLALTKVFFGWVLLACLAVVLIPALFLRPLALRVFVLTLSALVLCLPYLAYTFKVTGKVFYWGNSGGVQLYCMSLTEDYLLGDWLNFDAVLAHPQFFREQHEIFKNLASQDYVTRDEWFQKAAIKNIREKPEKFFRNWRANLNRMVFGYPQSRYPGADSALATGNRSVVYAGVFFLWGLCVIPLSLRWNRVPSELKMALVFTLIALGGLSLLSAIPRLIFPLIPPLLLMSFYALENLLKLEWVSEG